MLNIRTYPDPILREKTSPVKAVSAKERELFDQMCVYMYSHSGIGLAASQIGILRNIIVVDIGKGPLKFANPKIIERKGISEMEEGCLSLPSIYVNVFRAKEIILTALDENNTAVTIEVEGLLARVLQHEIDHLNGKLIIDYGEQKSK